MLAKTYSLLQSALLLACVLFIFPARTVAQAREQSMPIRIISANYLQVKGPKKHSPQLVVGAGRLAEGLRADWQRDLALVHQECGFEYVRFHGLLQDELGVYTEDAQDRKSVV